MWVATTTGARRGELCALQWECVDLDRAVLTLRRSIARDGGGGWYVKDTKTHQQRRVALDPSTVAVLTEHRERAEARAAAAGFRYSHRAFVFSLVPLLSGSHVEGGHRPRPQGSGQGREATFAMTADQTSANPADLGGRRPPSTRNVAGAAIHPRFLRSGPWALSSVVALLFGLSFATSYAALYDYALELEFPREFAIAFPLVLDAVIVVLAVTLLLERALGRRTAPTMGWQITVRLPTWPLIMLWVYFGGSVAGNVGHAPALLAAQLVAAVPPVSAALTFHLLLRPLDRAPMLRAIAETHEDRAVDERERAAARKAR